MKNYLITNRDSGWALGVASTSPGNEDAVVVFDPKNPPRNVSSAWGVKRVNGGFNIVLTNAPHLKLGVDTDKPFREGIGLFVYQKDTDNNTLWSGDQLEPFIVSLEKTGPDDTVLVIDVDGPDNTAQLWRFLANGHQRWSFTAV